MGSGQSALDSLEETVVSARDEIVKEHSNKNVDQAMFLAGHACEQTQSIEDTLHLLAVSRNPEAAIRVATALVDIAQIMGTSRTEYVRAVNNLITLHLVQRNLEKAEKWNNIALDTSGATSNTGIKHGANLAVCLVNSIVLYGLLKREDDKAWSKAAFRTLIEAPERQNQNHEGYFSDNRLIYRLDNLVQVYQENNATGNELNTLLLMKDALKHTTEKPLSTSHHTQSSPASLQLSQSHHESKEQVNTEFQEGGHWEGNIWVSDAGEAWLYDNETEQWNLTEFPSSPTHPYSNWPGSPVSNYSIASPTSVYGSFDYDGGTTQGSESAQVLFQTFPFCFNGDPDLDRSVLDAIETCFTSDLRDAVTACDEDGNTLLLAACKSRKVQVVRKVLDCAVNGSDNASDSRYAKDCLGVILRRSNLSGLSALHVACNKTYSNFEIAETLLAYDQYGSLVKLKDHDGCTPLHYAASTMDHNLVALLLVHQASPSQTDQLGFLPVDYCDPDDLESIHLLHSSNQQHSQQVAQHHLLHSGDPELVEALKKSLHVSESQFQKLQLELDRKLGESKLTQDELLRLKNEAEEERKKRMAAQSRTQQVESQLGAFQGEYDSMKKSLHHEQRDREKLTQELSGVVCELDKLSKECTGQRELSSDLAQRLAQLYEDKERIESRLRGSNIEIERLVKELESSLASQKLTEQQIEEANRELLVEQGLRQSGENTISKLEQMLAESQQLVQEAHDQVKLERLKAKQQLESKEELLSQNELALEKERKANKEREAALKDAKNNLEQLSDTISQKEMAELELQRTLQKVRDDLEAISNKANSKSAKHQREREELLKRERDLMDKCDASSSELSNLKSKLEQASLALSNAEVRAQEYREKYVQETKVNDAMKAQVCDMKDALKEASMHSESLKSQIETERKQHQTVNEKLSNVKNELTECLRIQEAERNLSAEQASELAKRIENLTCKEEDLELQLQKLEDDAETLKQQLASAERKHTYLEDEVKTMQERLAAEQERTLKANSDMRHLQSKLKDMEQDKAKYASEAQQMKQQEKAKLDAIAAEKASLLDELNREKQHRQKVLKDLESAAWEQKLIMKDRERMEKAKQAAVNRAQETLVGKIKAEEELKNLQHQLEKEREERLKHEREIQKLKESPAADTEMTEKLKKRLRQEQLWREQAIKELSEARQELNDGTKKRSEEVEQELNALKEKLRLENEQREQERMELEQVKASIASLEQETKEKTGQSEQQMALAASLQEQEAALQQKLLDMEKHMEAMKNEKEDLYKEFAEEQALRKRYYNEIEDLKGKIRVFCRVRPISESERAKNCKQVVVVEDPQHLTIQVPGKNDRPGQSLEFAFDSCFGPTTTQEQVFEDAKRLVQTAVDGYNVCVFAYGQTGSGKTYTLTGPDAFTKDSQQVQMSKEAEPHEGITTRSIREIFRLINNESSRFDFETSLYVIELYKNEMIDLLWKPSEDDIAKNETAQEVQPPPLSVHLDNQGVVYVENITMKKISSFEEAQKLLVEASAQRHVTETKMNAASSRSHLIQSMVIKATAKATGVVTSGKLTVVDLAGSERASKTGAKGDTLKEAQAINKSLLALGDVIQALTTGSKHVPYRNHPLTQLMADSLGGNAKTLMFVNISPVEFNVSESKESLRWATRVKNVTNSSHKSVETEQVRKLKAQLAKLKGAALGKTGALQAFSIKK